VWWEDGTSEVSKEPIELGEEGGTSTPPGEGGWETVMPHESLSDILEFLGAGVTAGVSSRPGGVIRTA
jgi:hypothetical protein